MKFYSFIFLALFLSLTGCHKKEKQLVVIFSEINGLTEGSSVYFKGFKVGQVDDLNLHNKGVLAKLGFSKDINIPVASSFTLKEAFTGGQEIMVISSGKNIFLNTLDTVYGVYKEENPMLDFFPDDSIKRQKAEKAIKKIDEGFKELLDAKKDSSAKTPD